MGGAICIKILRLMNNLERKANNVYRKRRRNLVAQSQRQLEGKKTISGVTGLVMEVHAYKAMLEPTTKLFAPSSLFIQI